MEAVAVRKYSFYKDGRWEHFPSRDGLVLVFSNRSGAAGIGSAAAISCGERLKLIWRTSVLEEVELTHSGSQSGSTVALYHRCPAVGFRYVAAAGNREYRKFQVSFISTAEYTRFVELARRFGLGEGDDNRQSHQDTALGYQYSAMRFPDTQLDFPSQNLQMSQRSIRDPLGANDDNNSIDYISTILNEQNRSQSSFDLNDDELKKLILTKIKDTKFIDFVERIEHLLKTIKS